MVFLQVRSVVGEVAAAELDGSVGVVEQLDPSVPLAESVNQAGGILAQDFPYPQVREILRTGFSQSFTQVAAWMKLFYLAKHRQINFISCQSPWTSQTA